MIIVFRETRTIDPHDLANVCSVEHADVEFLIKSYVLILPSFLMIGRVVDPWGKTRIFPSRPVILKADFKAAFTVFAVRNLKTPVA